jgi:hypothetical protein
MAARTSATDCVIPALKLIHTRSQHVDPDSKRLRNGRPKGLE